MGLGGVVVSVLALTACASASVGDNALDGGERVVLVAPVLAPPRGSRNHVTDRSRQFPILVLLARANPEYVRLEPEAKSLKGNPEPIYVKKLEDQEKSSGPLNRQKRHLHLKKTLLFGGGGGLSFGGGGGFGYGGGGGYEGYPGGGFHGGYQEPSKTIIVKVVKDHDYGYGGHGGHHGGGYNNGGGYGGGYGGGGGGGYGVGYGGGGGYGVGGGYGGGGGGGGYSGGGGYGGGGGGHGGGNGGGGNYGHGGGGHGPVHDLGCGGGCGGGYGNVGATATATATATASAGSYGYGKR